jgi:uncharacterized protein (TIGR00251 family)
MQDFGSANDRAAAGPFRYEGDALTLRLHVQPGAARTGWAGLHGEDALKLRLSAPAVEGRANRACLDYLAEQAGVPRRSVTLLRGEHAREKTVRIAPLSEAQFQALRRQWRF